MDVSLGFSYDLRLLTCITRGQARLRQSGSAQRTAKNLRHRRVVVEANRVSREPPIRSIIY